MFYRILQIYVSLQYAVSNTVEECLDPTITMEYVQSCPQNTTAWQKSAEMKNCSAYKNICGDDMPVKYHCVMNAYRNATLEICAAEVSIVGYHCPEYNEYGNLIQEHYGTVCKTCPFYYYSTEIYKYPECIPYQHTKEKNVALLTTDSDHTSVESTTIQNTLDSTPNSSSVNASNTSSTTSTRVTSLKQLIIIITVCCLLLTVILIAFALWKENHSQTLEDNSPQLPLLANDLLK